VSGEYDRADDYYADQENAELCGGDDYTEPRSIADTLEELSKLYPAIPQAVKQFETGAVRSMDAETVRYDLITPIGLARLAGTYAEGARKYSDNNWLRGMPISDLLNHAIRQQYLYLSGDRSEDHLAHAAWGLFAAMHSEEKWPHLNTGLLGPGCTLPGSPITEVEF
jgi:hypothetical protein